MYISKPVYIVHLIKTETKLNLTCFALQFEGALNQINPLEALRKLVDPRLGDNYPIESVLKVETFFCEYSLHIIFYTFSLICVITIINKKITITSLPGLIIFTRLLFFEI